MIRGAFILAIGFGLGYAKAMSEQEQIIETITKTGDKVVEFLDRPTTDDDVIDGKATPVETPPAEADTPS